MDGLSYHNRARLNYGMLVLWRIGSYYWFRLCGFSHYHFRNCMRCSINVGKKRRDGSNQLSKYGIIVDN